MIRTAALAPWRPAGASLRLAQAAAGGVRVRIAVVDVDGKPVEGATVTARVSDYVYEGATPPGAGSDRGETDSRGIFEARFVGPLAGAAEVDILVEKGPYAVTAKGTVDQGNRGVIFVVLPVCLPQPFLTKPELVSLLAAAALTAAGFYWKVQPLQITGEVFFGAVVFTALYRLSCL